MRAFLMLCASCPMQAISRASACGSFTPGVCMEKAASSLNESVVYTRTFPKCCKPSKTNMTFREGVGCLKEDSDFLHSFVGCIKSFFDQNEDYNALKPADAMAKIGPDTIQYVLSQKPGLKKLFEKVAALPGTDRTYWDPFDGDKWIDPGDALAGFGQQQFFRFAVGAMPHGSRGQGVQDGDDGNAPPNNPLNTYQKVGEKYNYSAVSFWAGAGNGFNDVLTVPTSTMKAANIGFFVRSHDIETVAELFRVVGEAGTNLFEKGMHMKAMHTDGQDVPLLHVRLDMEQKKEVLWPASRDLTPKHEAKMICLAFQSLLNAPWTLKQLNAAWANDLKPNVAHLTWSRSDFVNGFVMDTDTNGPFTQLLAGKWDGNCASTPTNSDWMLPIIVAIVCAAIVIVPVGVIVAIAHHHHCQEPLERKQRQLADADMGVPHVTHHRALGQSMFQDLLIHAFASVVLFVGVLLCATGYVGTDFLPQQHHALHSLAWALHYTCHAAGPTLPILLLGVQSGLLPFSELVHKGVLAHDPQAHDPMEALILLWVHMALLGTGIFLCAQGLEFHLCGHIFLTVGLLTMVQMEQAVLHVASQHVAMRRRACLASIIAWLVAFLLLFELYFTASENNTAGETWRAAVLGTLIFGFALWWWLKHLAEVARAPRTSHKDSKHMIERDIRLARIESSDEQLEQRHLSLEARIRQLEEQYQMPQQPSQQFRQQQPRELQQYRHHLQNELLGATVMLPVLLFLAVIIIATSIAGQRPAPRNACPHDLFSVFVNALIAWAGPALPFVVLLVRSMLLPFSELSADGVLSYRVSLMRALVSWPFIIPPLWVILIVLRIILFKTVCQMGDFSDHIFLIASMLAMVQMELVVIHVASKHASKKKRAHLSAAAAWLLIGIMLYESFITARYYHTRAAVWRAAFTGLLVFLPAPSWWLHLLSGGACLA